MILYAVSTILSLFALFALSLPYVIIGLIHTAILAYFYVVIYSVYDLLRREYESAFGRQNQEARKALNDIWTDDKNVLWINIYDWTITNEIISPFDDE